MGPVLIQQYLDAEPVHLQIRAPEVWVPEVADETVFEPNLPYRGVFRRQSSKFIINNFVPSSSRSTFLL